MTQPKPYETFDEVLDALAECEQTLNQELKIKDHFIDFLIEEKMHDKFNNYLKRKQNENLRKGKEDDG